MALVFTPALLLIRYLISDSDIVNKPKKDIDIMKTNSLSTEVATNASLRYYANGSRK